MIRIANWYESRLGRNDGNPLYVTHVFNRDYKDKVEFRHLAPDPQTPLGPFGTFDLNIWVDWGEDALKEVLAYEPMACPRPNAYWISDSHLGWDYRLQKAREFDHVFVAQQHHVEPMAEALKDSDVRSVTWLPHAVEPQAYNPAAVYAKTTAEALALRDVHRPYRWDLVFVGFLTQRHRVEFLDTVFKAIPASWYATRFFERAADAYTSSKIVLNHAMNNDLNMRVFEALATRSFLLTPQVPGLLDLFDDGIHLMTYESVEDCIEKARYYIEHDDQRERIAQAGYDAVLKDHTMAHRVRRILEQTGVEV